MSEDQIAAGKKLFKPLLHPTTGKVLLPAGTVLTDAYIERLGRQGLTQSLAACLEAVEAGGTGGPVVKDLDSFDIEIPDLPDLFGEFFGPAAGATSAPGWVPTGQPAASQPVAAQATAAPPGAANWVPGAAGQAAATPGWVPTGQASASATVPAAPPAGAPGQPGWMPPAGSGAANTPGWVPTGQNPAAPQPAAPPPAPNAAQVAAANQVARYYHNPTHFLPERAVMGAMYAFDAIESQLKSGQTPSNEGIRRVVDEVIERLTAKSQDLNNGIKLRIVNQPHARSHPVNVMILSIVTGLALNYDQERLRTLAVAALCHDIGKTAIPDEVLNKIGALSAHEVELLRAHPLMGKRIMEKLPWGSPLLARVVYEHHERNDGSGYPLKLTAVQIHEMSKIVAIAEVYDALISDTSYRARYTPELSYTTIKNGEKMGLDGQMIRAFMKYVFPYPLQSFVMMENQEIGQVVQINRLDPLRPTIKIGTQTIDLASRPERKILNSHYQPY